MIEIFTTLGMMFMIFGFTLHEPSYFIASGLFFVCMSLNRFFNDMILTDVGFMMDESIKAAKRVMEKHKEDNKDDR
jgi:hypothetical protein